MQSLKFVLFGVDLTPGVEGSIRPIVCKGAMSPPG